MRRPAFIIILILVVQIVFAQKSVKNEFSSIDKKALEIPDSLTKTTQGIAGYINLNFDSDADKVRAIYIWIVSNINYDIDNMFALNFYEPAEEKINKPLKFRKGICENYAALFNDICAKSKIKSFVIEGYTKQNGFADYIPHAWCAVKIDSSWFMFDPTWGSGYIINSKFIKKTDNNFFKTDPSALIKTHMPFDFLWQFLNYPVSNQEFYEGKTQQNKLKPFFNFSDSIKIYESQSNIEQLVASARRVEKNGVKNSLIYDRLQHLKMEIENDRLNKIVNLYNSAVADYNDGINSYNEFIQYRNHQFTPKKSDPEIQVMIDAADVKYSESKTKLSKIINPDPATASAILKLNKSIGEAAALLQEQKDWLKVYFSKGKSGRKSMFYDRKITFFGLPVN
jgi:transglutaminase/protease-like cytokinesis protein 3